MHLLMRHNTFGGVYCESNSRNSEKEEMTSSFFIENRILVVLMEVYFCREAIPSLRQSSVRDVLHFRDRFSLGVVTVKMPVMALGIELTGEHQLCGHPDWCGMDICWWDGFQT